MMVGVSEPVASAHRPWRAGKVSVVGVGSVGTAVAHACLIRGSAGALALYDVNAKKVHAEVLDLNHGSQFVPYCRVEGSDDIAVTADSAVVIVTAGAKQHPGQSRLDLAATNVTMAQELTPLLLEQSPDAIVVVVTNPVDVVTYAAALSVTAAPGRIFGSGTVLDSSRFRFLIAQRANLAVGNIHGLIIGEHGDSEIPLWSSVSVGGVPAAQFRSADGAVVFDEGRATRSLRAWSTRPTRLSPARARPTWRLDCRRPASSKRFLATSTGCCRFQRCSAVRTTSTGVALSLPTAVSAAGAGRALEVPLSGSELAGLRASADTLRDAQRFLGLTRGCYPSQRNISTGTLIAMLRDILHRAAQLVRSSPLLEGG